MKNSSKYHGSCPLSQLQAASVACPWDLSKCKVLSKKEEKLGAASEFFTATLNAYEILRETVFQDLYL